jgi:muconolactone delta-isomerase
MDGFMVVATFRQGVDMAEVMAVVAEEQARVAELRREGSLGAVHLATAARGTVFLEVFAGSAEEAQATVASLPMAAWWDIDVFPLNPPVGARTAG